MGNCFGLQRSRDDVTEAVEIVAGNTNAPHIYDSFAFVATGMRDHLSVVPDEFASSVLVGTSTLSCFTWDDDLVGGMLVSLPWVPDSEADETAFFNSYQQKFGEKLVETFRDRPNYGKTEVVDVSPEDIGLSDQSITVLDSSTTSVGGEQIATFGFVSNQTINILYLVSDGNVDSVEKFRSIVRQLDTLTVFESPKSHIDVTGSVWVPCSRVLDSSKFQSYIESEYVLSNGSHLNLANLDNPQLYVDSELQFSLSGQMFGDCKIEVIGSRNANQIESQARKATKSVAPLELDEYASLKSGAIGEHRNGGEVFIGQTYVDWRCGCESQVCPTVIIIRSNEEITERTLSQVDDVLCDIDGREPFEVTIGDVTVDAVKY